MTAAPSLGLPLGNGRFVRAANRSDVPGVQWYRGKEAWKRARGSSRRIHTFYMCVYVYAYAYLYIKWRDLWVVQEFGVHGDVLRGVSKHPEPSCEPLEVSERGAATKKEVTACGRNDYDQCNLASAVPCGRRLPSCAELMEGLLGSSVSEADHADPQPSGILPEAFLTAAPSLSLPLGNGRFVRAANRSDVPGVQWDRGSVEARASFQ